MAEQQSLNTWRNLKANIIPPPVSHLCIWFISNSVFHIFKLTVIVLRWQLKTYDFLRSRKERWAWLPFSWMLLGGANVHFHKAGVLHSLRALSAHHPVTPPLISAIIIFVFLAGSKYMETFLNRAFLYHLIKSRYWCHTQCVTRVHCTKCFRPICISYKLNCHCRLLRWV